MHQPNYTYSQQQQPNYQSPPPQYGVQQPQQQHSQNMYPQQYGVQQQQQQPQMMMQQSQYSPQYQQSNMQQLAQYGVQQPSMYHQQQQQPQQYQPQMILPQSTTQQSLYQQQQSQPQQMMHSSYMIPQQQQQQMMIPQQVYQQQPQQQMTMQQTTLYEKPMTQVQFVQQTTMPPPINQNMMQAMRLVAVEEAAKEWYKKRVELLALLETMVKGLDKKQKSSAKAKIGGTATNIVGASLIVGGIIAAPFTLGGSLLATGAGLGCVGAGTTTTVVASVMEWKHAKKTALLVQELLQKDTQSVNDMIKKIYEYRLNDPYIETRTITIGTCAVNVVQFVEALVSFRNQGLDSTGGLTNGNAGVVSLASLMIKGTIPIISIPVDMVLLVEESKKAHGKEPSKLALKILPIMDGIKMQTQRATGNFM